MPKASKANLVPSVGSVPHWFRQLAADDLQESITRSHETGLDEYHEAARWREQTRVLEMDLGASRLVLEKDKGFELFEGEGVRGKRGKIMRFSPRSRQKLLETGSSIRSDALPLFVHLTYPEQWPADSADWKWHLKKFWQRLSRKFPKACFLWKLEPQERGAPHFHLLVWGVNFIAKQWLSKAWYKVVGSNDGWHLLYGTKIERARSVRGVQAYMSKNYMGKECSVPHEWDSPGRFWGVYGRKNLPKGRRVRMTITWQAACRLRRLARRVLQNRGCIAHARKLRGRYVPRICLFGQNLLEWARALDWAEGCETRPRSLDGSFAPRLSSPDVQPF